MVKIGVIGIGHVGSHVLYTLALKGVADEIVLIDENEAKAKSEAQDLFDAALYLPHKTKVYVGDFKDLRDCDVIVHAAGKITLLRESKNRDAELNFTVPMVRSYIPKIKDSGFHGIFINITNPCDVITREFDKGLGLAKGHAFGTGTGLDTARLVSQLEMATGVNAKSIDAYMIGEHGNSQMCAWSNVHLGGVSLADSEFNLDTKDVQYKAAQGGWVTFSGKYCTEYAIASCAVNDVLCVLHDEKKIIPASVELNGEYNQNDVYAGVPCVIGKNGVEKIVELKLTKEENEEFQSCCDSIRLNIEKAKKL